MHVGLNLVYLVPGAQGGMETYARELSAQLAARDDVRVTAFVNRVTGDWPTDTVVVPVDARRRVGWVLGEQQHLPRLAARAGCDLVHSLASTAPVYGRFRRVTTIHDIAFKLLPEAHFGINALGMRVLVSAAARRSDRIIAVSSAARDEIVDHLHVDASRVDVVPNGFGLPQQSSVTPAGELRARLGLDGRQVVLSVSAKRPHKNLARLLGALARIPSDRRPVLINPGYTTQYEAELRARAADLDLIDDVRFLGWVSAEDLEGLYALADAFVFPSLYEGFGLPVLEAMARGVPVACANGTSLREVAGDAALLFDGEREDEIAETIEHLLADGPTSRRLRDAGRARAARFTWERTAELTVASYRRALAA